MFVAEAAFTEGLYANVSTVSGECVKQKLIMVELRQTVRKLTEMGEADEEDDQYGFMWGVSI